jgi:hypothetical protein
VEADVAREQATIEEALQRALDKSASHEALHRLELATKGRILSSYAHQFYSVACFLKSIGEVAAAHSCLVLIELRCRDTEFGDSARALLLRSPTQTSPEVGLPIPALGNLRDIGGKPIALANSPSLILFVSFAHESSMKRLARFSQAWASAGLPASNLLVFALESDASELARIARLRDLQCRIVAGQDGFANPLWARFDVRAVPQAYLLDSDGTVRVRDLTPDRVAPLLAGK